MKSRILFYLSVAVVLSACGGGIGKMGASSEGVVQIPLKVSVNSPYFVNDLKQSLYERIRGGESVPFGEVTQALVKDHHSNWIDRHKEAKNNPELSAFYKQVQELGNTLPADFGAAKQEIESRVGKGAAVAYNTQAISVMDVTQDKKLQSYSGTLLFFLVLREARGRDQFTQSNLVAIFESGHVLPGYLVKNAEGEWDLIGIETTVEGTGRVLYGSAKKATKERMLRMVDAELFSIVELFKFEADNLVEMANQALDITAAKYGIAENTPHLVQQRFRREADYGKIAWTPFGFGSVDIGLGDRVRAALDESPREKLPRANPNITVVHKPAEPAPEPKPTVKTTPTSQAFVPNYPYREVKAPSEKSGKRFQCWDYAKQTWVDMPFTEVDGEYLIDRHPCAYSRGGSYEALPAPLRMRPMGRGVPPGYNPYLPYGGGSRSPYGGGYDPDDDDY